MAEPYRVAVYYAPAADDPLWHLGSAWLGRDAESGAPLARPDLPGLAAATAEPRRYGLHATLKAPFIPRHGLEAFMRDAEAFAANRKPFPLPRLAVTWLDGFLALCPAAPSAALQSLADDCVRVFDGHRLAEDEAAQRRRGAGRPPRQRENIARWGYPLVFGDFHFHMTLTGRLGDDVYREAAEAYFAPALARPRQLGALAIFIEPEKDAPFRLVRRLAFSSEAASNG